MLKATPAAYRPSQQEIQAARGRTVPDVIVPGLKVLFCGINPSLYSAAVQHHFARPGNRFWKALHRAGFTARQLSPFEESELLATGYGITNLAQGATARANELAPDELTAGVRHLITKVQQYQPRLVAVLGIGAYRQAFQRPEARLGLQDERIGPSRLWVLPNPSGLNGHYSLEQLSRLFRELYEAAEGEA